MYSYGLLYCQKHKLFRNKSASIRSKSILTDLCQDIFEIPDISFELSVKKGESGYSTNYGIDFDARMFKRM